MQTRLRSLLAVLILFPAWLPAQGPARSDAWIYDIGSQYSVTPNLSYTAGDGSMVSLDLFVPRGAGARAPAPTVLYIHGGAWMGGDKAVAVLRFLPWLERGWAVVNINYRLAPAPAAVEDARCALRWITSNAARHHLDPARVVVTGDSAGSHLALMAGMAPPQANLDGRCGGASPVPVAAIVSWFGMADVTPLVDGPARQAFAVQWIGSGGVDLARRLSPVTYVRAGLPPILLIHGESDAIAPYADVVRLQAALDAAKTPNRLITIPGRGHGNFTREEVAGAYDAIWRFLAR